MYIIFFIFLFVNTLKVLSQSLVDWKTYAKKCACSFMGAPSYMMNLFSLLAIFRILLLTLSFAILYMSWCRLLWISYIWTSLGFMNLHVHFFLQTWNVSGYESFKKAFRIFLSFLRVCVCVCVCMRAHAQSCPTLWDLMICSPSGSSVHGIFQARTLKWVPYGTLIMHI